jgi:acyl transferase domain-containing protein
VVKKNQDQTDFFNEPLAIIGMNCQLPGIEADVTDVDAFYTMLLQGLSPIKEIPKSRWDVNHYYDPDREKPDKMLGRKGGFLSNPELFDAAFFKISAAEAKQMDPQQRLFLEVAIRALNHANIRLDSLNNSNTGIFCGTSAQDYSQLNYKDAVEFNSHTLIGAASSAIAGRLAHFLNLKGPAMAVDTACSSSLSALYLAALSLRMQECAMAIVGGVHLNLCPENFIGLSKANMLSASDTCSSFSSDADGFVRSEGCAVVIVKRLSDAIKDQDTIHAVIKSIVMNQDGDDDTPLVAPNIKSQINLHQAALAQAQLQARDIDYIETHGTGTIVGDSVEFNAIQAIHQGQHVPEKPLIIGALKSVIGHGIASSGIASLIKAVCAFKYKHIAPNLHFVHANPNIDPESIPAFFPLEIPSSTLQTPSPQFWGEGSERRIQISNFGFTGTNVFAIIEEAPQQPIHSSTTEKQEHFILSAQSEASLKQILASYVAFLKASPVRLSDICATLINCRDEYKYSCSILADSKQELIRKIEAQEYEIKKIKPSKSLVTTRFNKVALPLYHFDRKPYWHEPRTKKQNTQWLFNLYRQTKEQQIELIKEKLAEQIRELISAPNLQTISTWEHEDLVSLGLDHDLLLQLNQSLSSNFSYHFDITHSEFLTLDKLSRHVQQIIVPTLVAQQPSINVLNNEPIAIIGMACRFPKAPNIESFLSLLERGESGMSDIPLDRWDNEKYYDADVTAPGRLCIKQLGLIDDVKNFDAEFFNISPREAKLMSPQLRVFLETSYHALEHANLPLTAIKESNTGVFVGVGTNEYPRILAGLGINLDDLNIYFATGNVLNAIAGRVAYTFDFNGPIQAIDTACSSAMTAIHNACISLQSGDCDMALAGGVNILLAPDSNITLSKARMLSPDSRSKTFSEDADGYARSEGCGIVVLKRLSNALKDNDTIHALIKGSAINSDGKSGGFTVPNALAQEEVIRHALAKAQLDPKDIDYIEAHGTGTPLADPIEANTLVKIFSESHSQEKPLYISAVKTNIGHAESAAGAASIIKAVLSLQTHQLFKHLNFKKLNPAIELKNTQIPLKTIAWIENQKPRYAGVSSFGFSGANAHVVLGEGPAKSKSPHKKLKESLLVLSAKTHHALEQLLKSYQKYLAQTDEDFHDICYTAALGRTHFTFRVAVKADSAKTAALLIANKSYHIYKVKNVQNTSAKATNLEELQTAFEQGFTVNWAEYYTLLNMHFAKVNLPLYEFDREEFWFDIKNRLQDSPLPKDWYFELQWQHQAINKKHPKITGTNWLLLGPAQLAERFKSQGLHIYFEQDNFPIEKLSGIIFAEGLDAPTNDNCEAAFTFQKDILKHLVHLIKKSQLQLIILTKNAIAELPAPEINLSSSPLIGFCKTLVLELPQLQTILIDSDHTDVARVVDEINYNYDSEYEHLIAYRDNKRLVARLKPMKLIDKRRSLIGKGRYLITGGCGGLGLISAQALLSAGARELILTARNIDKPAIKTALKKIHLDYPGRIIKAISLDSTDKAQVQKVLSELNSDGLLKGIIHAAGTGFSATVLDHQDTDIDTVFAAKVQGGWYLHELSKTFDLNFFIVYSSISSVIGSNKESVYSAANSFLDALIAERHRLGFVGTAIQWGSWGETGMAKKRAQIQSLKNALISNALGHTLIKIFINDQMMHAAVIAPEYLKFMLDFVPRPMPGLHKTLAQDLTTLTEGSETIRLSTWLTDYKKMPEETRFAFCKQLIIDTCKPILDLDTADELDEDEGFFNLGFDSLMITELATKLKEQLAPAVSITATIGFNYPSINKLANHIKSELDNNLIINQTPILNATKIDDSIAIIGMSCNFPNAPDLDAFTQMLEQGINGVTDIPKERWDNDLYYDPNIEAPGKSYVTKLGLVHSITDFDPQFFDISPREAKFIDPQQRLFLEGCYKAIEHANYPVHSLRGSLTGVFAGVGPNEYYGQLEKSGFSNEELSLYSITGNVLNLIPGRVAYEFDFKGPSLSIDTACSSSMVAVHYACQSLKNHEIDYALAGGVNVLLMPESNITLCKAKALAPDGACKTFDARADGYARGEGCGVLLLKRLSDALRDKDCIFAVIKASAVNNDGKSAGLTVPNGISQEQLMRTALNHSNLSNIDISYIEAHGTGTSLGDPIEVDSINKVYGASRTQENPLYLGSVKTNIGHLESAAGIASIIKTIICLRNQKIYKLLHFHNLNPHIKLGTTRLATETIYWPTDSKPRTAGVNAFGFSGTNAHIIMQEFSSAEIEQHFEANHLLVLSAKSKTSLQLLAKRYQTFLANTQEDFGAICFTAATGREHYPYRLALTAKNSQEACERLISGDYAFSHEEHSNTFITEVPVHKSLVSLFMQGIEVDWGLYYKTFAHEFKKVQLPNYEFDKRRFWLDKKEKPGLLGDEAQHLAHKDASALGIEAPKKQSLLQTLIGSEHETRITLLHQTLREIIASILGLDNPEDIKLDTGLFSLGLDSLMAVEIRNRIHDTIASPNLYLSVEYFINEPTVDKIARAIALELSKRVTNKPVSPQTQTANLCDFQYLFWMLNKLDANHLSGAQIQIHGDLNKEFVAKAFSFIVEHNSVFWLNFNKEVPIQVLNKQGKFELQYKDYSSNNVSSVLNNEFYTHLYEDMPLSQQPLIRVYLYKISSGLHELHLIIPHIIVDGTSCDIIMRLFKTYYEQLTQGKKLIAAPEPHSFLDYATRNNHLFQKNLSEKINFWRKSNKGFKNLMLKPAHLLSTRPDKYLTHYPIDENLMKDFINWHSSRNINISTGLIAACHYAFYQINQQNKLAIITLHSGREGSTYNSVLGLFIEQKRINSTLDPNAGFYDFVLALDEQQLISAPYQACFSVIKNRDLMSSKYRTASKLLYFWNRIMLTKAFKKAKLHSILIDYYLEYFSWIAAQFKAYAIKESLTKLIPFTIFAPKGLRVLINITPSFFGKTAEDMHFANLTYEYPSHFGSEDRYTGDWTIWILFSRNLQGEYLISINGPVSQECKDEIAKNFSNIVDWVIDP